MVALNSKCYVLNFFLFDDKIAVLNKMKIEFSILNIEQLEGLLIKFQKKSLFQKSKNDRGGRGWGFLIFLKTP